MKKENVILSIRIFFYLVILIALIYVGIKAGGDPCSRCTLKDSSLGDDKEHSCREIIGMYVNKSNIINSLQETKIPEKLKLNNSLFIQNED